ncbi:MAG: hypothetical protein ER33_11625 [Cyanobium sp. CACIAM 14]|nr:MAG: hypothetical protein ER33_11625 [Cyanobium sp. CACIAM 14]
MVLLVAVAVTQQALDQAQVHALLEQVGGIGVTERVNRQPFLDATLLAGGLEGGLDTAGIHRCAGHPDDELASGRTGEEQTGVTVGCPEPAKRLEREIGDGDIAILTAFGIAEVHTSLAAVNVRHLKSQAFTLSQTQAVDHQQEDTITQLAYRIDQRMHFLSGRNVREATYTGWADDLDPLHLAVEHIAMEELEAAEIHFDCAP